MYNHSNCCSLIVLVKNKHVKIYELSSCFIGRSAKYEGGVLFLVEPIKVKLQQSI